MTRRPDPEQIGPAIAVLTAWANSGDDLEQTTDVLLSYVAEGIPEEVLVGGLLNLASILLIKLEKATGTPAPELMRDLAAKYMT